MASIEQVNAQKFRLEAFIALCEGAGLLGSTATTDKKNLYFFTKVSERDLPKNR